MKKIYAVIPAYEPGKTLINTAMKAKEFADVIVVDDGSGKDYSEIFEKISRFAYIISYEKNMGKGYAMKKAFEYIKENGKQNSVIVTLDADGQHRAEDAMKIAEYSIENPNILVLGCRKLDKNVPLRSRFGNSITRFVFRFMTGKKVYDTQTGLRAFGFEMIEKMLEIPGKRYEYEMNALMIVAREGIQIKEIEIPTIYIGKNESSHFNTFTDSIRIYAEILKFGVSSFISFLVDYGIYSLVLLIFGAEYYIFANIFARVISATLNFTMNRQLVFHSKTNLFKGALKYFALAIFVLSANTLILDWICAFTPINPFIAKIIVEASLFIISYTIQHKFIFFEKKEAK